MLDEGAFIDTVLETDDLLDVFEVIYSSGGCVEAFHKKKGSRGVRLTGWGDGERSVSYSVAIQAPAVVTNIVGTELDLEETQRVFWTSISGEVMPDPFTSTTPGSAGMSSWSSKTSASDLPSEPISFTVVCTPQLISGGDRFFTELEFHFRKRAAGMGGGIRAMCSVKVEAHVWGIQSSLEPWMMAEVKKNLTEFFPFMSEFFHMNSKAAMTPAVLEPEVPATPRGRQAGRFNSAASVAREITKKGSEQPTVSPGSSGERLYDADEVVPRGVRAAVQMFEGGNVMGKGTTKRPAFRSRSPSPQNKLSRLPIASILETASINTTPTPTPPGSQNLPTPRTPHSARSPLTYEANARRVSASAADPPSARDTASELTPRLEPTFTLRRKNYSTKGAKRSLEDTLDRDRIDSSGAFSPRPLGPGILPSGTDTNASTSSEAVFPQSSLEPRFPGFDSDPPPHDASVFAMHSTHEAIPEVPDPGSHDGDSHSGVELREELSRGPGPGRTWSQRTNNESAAETDATLEFLFHDAVSGRARRMSGDSAAHSQSQSTLFESVVPESVSTCTSTANLQEERCSLTLESVNWKLGAAEQRIDDLSERVRDCVALVHEVREGSEAGGPAGSVGDASRASMGLPHGSGSMLGYGPRIVEGGDSARCRMASLQQSSAGVSTVRSNASTAALATGAGFAVGVALGMSAVVGMVLLRPNQQ